MRSPDSSRFFANVASEIEAALIQLRHATKTHERLALVRELRSLLFLLGFMPIEKQQLAIAPPCPEAGASDEMSETQSLGVIMRIPNQGASIEIGGHRASGPRRQTYRQWDAMQENSNGSRDKIS